MKLKKAVKIVKRHNKWRRGHYDITDMQDTTDIGNAIDVVVKACEKTLKANSKATLTHWERFEKHLQKHNALKEYHNNLNVSLSVIQKRQPQDYLAVSFIWMGTPQGSLFWGRIDENWVKKCQQ